MSLSVTITPAELPSLPLDERRALPDVAAIYFVMAGSTVLYIGQAINVRQRWLAHHRLTQLNEYGGCRIAWMQVDDAGLLDELEQACIGHFTPVLNGSDVRWCEDGNRPVTMLFAPSVVQRIRQVAERKGVPFTVLLRMWAIEKLDEEDKQRESRS